MTSSWRCAGGFLGGIDFTASAIALHPYTCTHSSDQQPGSSPYFLYMCQTIPNPFAPCTSYHLTNNYSYQTSELHRQFHQCWSPYKQHMQSKRRQDSRKVIMHLITTILTSSFTYIQISQMTIGGNWSESLGSWLDDLRVAIYYTRSTLIINTLAG